MRTVFLDTVGLIAIWDEDDQWHAPAEAAWGELARDRVRFVTSTLVMYECGNACARRPYRGAVTEFRRAINANGGLITPTAEDVEAAWHEFERQDKRGAGIVDHISFGIMRRLGLSDAFTCDRHFQAAGFITLFG